MILTTYSLRLVLFSTILSSVYAQQATRYPDIPRIDVHAHIGNKPEVKNAFLKMRQDAKAKLDVELALWINLGDRTVDLQQSDTDDTRFEGRFLTCIYDYFIADGLRHSPESLAEWHLRGVAGYKIWAKRPLQPSASYSEPDVALPWRGIDDPANSPTFTKMEQLGMVAASVDISSPSHAEYPPYDPVKIWRDVRAWERVLERHPNLKVVNAHMMFLIGSNDQLNYLRYMLDTYPNLSVDIAADTPFFRWLDPKVLRAFMIKYSDRVLFGTDIGQDTKGALERYSFAFQVLETDAPVKSGNRTIQGLNLPREVLEKIYYKNALRVYDRARRAFMKLGY